MTRLTLHLLGPLSATSRTDQRVDFAYDKVRALLAYLAVEHDRAHPRSRLAALLWPEKSESAARHSLSQALSVLRRSIDDAEADSPLLRTDRNTIQFDIQAGAWVDVLEFDRLLHETEAHDHESPADCSQCLWRLERAIGLARGSLLDGFSVPDSEEFEDWLRAQQQSVDRSLEQALRTLVAGLERRGEGSRAADTCLRLVQLDPLDEDAHRIAMRLLAASGQRAAAIKQFEICRETLERDLDVEPEDETLQLHERIRSGLEGPTSFERVVSPPTTIQSTLPIPATTFVGREDEVERIGRLVESGDSRLITMTGPGGIGKTRLALEVARQKKSGFPDGVHFVPLSGVTSTSLLPSAILDGISAQVNRQGDSREQLLAYLQRREMLLLLDNFEHLVDGSVLIAEMLEAAPALQILVTSRERLSLTGEWVYDVEALSLPLDAKPTSIATSGAARLFMLCARKNKASFLPRQEDGPSIERICRLTGGMPLALELAAAWIPVLSPDEIADEIEQSLDFLSSSMRDLPERHQSVRAVIDRSWENLTEVEQRSLRRLSVFQGGFQRAAASYVTGASLPVLSALVSKSLLMRDNNGRYGIHELLRQYGEMRLEAAEEDESDVVRDRHRDYYIGFLAVRQEELEGKRQVSVLEEIGTEIENVRAAWRRAAATGDVAGLSRAAHSLWLFYETTGRFQEGVDAFERAFLAVRSKLPEAGTDEEMREFQLALGRLRSRQAALGFRLIGPNIPSQQLREAHDWLQGVDAPAEMGLQFNYFAVAAHALGELDEEESLLNLSIEEFQRGDYRWGLAYSQNDLGHLRALRGDYLGARSLHQTALAILEELGDWRGVAFALRNLGLVASRLGDTVNALALLRRSVDVRRPIGNQWGIAESLNQIGVILRDADQVEDAREHFREALYIARDIRAMQLAAEILREYIPLLDDDHVQHERFSRPGGSVSRSQQDRDSIAESLLIDDGSDVDADEVSRVLEIVLADASTPDSSAPLETEPGK